MPNNERKQSPSPAYTVVEKREIISVTVDVETGLTDILEKVELTKDDGTLVSSTVQRTTMETAEAGGWITDAVTLSKKVEQQPVA